MSVMTNLGSIFSPKELTYIIVLSAVIALIIIANIVLFYFIRKHRERKLCTQQLQQKRDSLMSHLASITDDGSLAEDSLIFASAPAPAVVEDDDINIDIEDEEETDDDDVDDEDDDDEDSDDDSEQQEGDELAPTEILAVADMSEYTRRKLGLVGEEYDDKSYFVRYKYGFDAKLRAASDEVKQRYTELVNELTAFKGVKITTSFRGQRVYKGRKTLAQIVIRGKTLCIAFALDPKDYEETKYAGIDKSDKKRFEKTPMLYKISSARRLDYARYLILQLAEANTLVTDTNAAPYPVDYAPKTLNELFEAQAIRIVVVGEISNSQVEADPELMLVGYAYQEPSAEEEQDDITVETPDGTLVIDRSFTARIIQANDDIKERYSVLKNNVMSYKGVHSKTGWKRENFSLGKDNVVSFALRGTTLMLYLAVNLSALDKSRYKVENLSDVAIRRKTPLLFRVMDDQLLEQAKLLIEKVMIEHRAERVERKAQDYKLPYKPTDVLVKKDLVKITTRRN